MKELRRMEQEKESIKSFANGESRSSVEVTKNTKGYSWSVKRYYSESEKVGDVLKELEKTEATLKAKFGEQ